MPHSKLIRKLKLLLSSAKLSLPKMGPSIDSVAQCSTHSPLLLVVSLLISCMDMLIQSLKAELRQQDYRLQMLPLLPQLGKKLLIRFFWVGGIWLQILVLLMYLVYIKMQVLLRNGIRLPRLSLNQLLISPSPPSSESPSTL